MNQNNNYSFDPMTGQPINNQPQQPMYNQQVNPATQQFQQPQQPMYNQQVNPATQQFQQPQQTYNTYRQPVQPQKSKKNNKIFIIIAVIAVVSIIAGIFLFTNHDKKESTNNETTNNPEVENNNSTGNVEEGTNTSYDENGAFLFSIGDIFTIAGRGTVVTGSVQRGKIKVGDTVQIIGLDQEILTAEVTGIEMFRESREEATFGDNAGIILKDITIEQVERGQVLAKPNSIVAATKFDAEAHILSKEEGGRHTPFFEGYRPQFYFRTTDITGVIDLPDNIEMVNPGDDVSFTATLVSNVAMEVGTEFSIREGGRTVGTGKVTKVY